MPLYWLKEYDYFVLRLLFILYCCPLLTFSVRYFIFNLVLKVVRKRSRSSSLSERMTHRLRGCFKKNALKVAFELHG